MKTLLMLRHAKSSWDDPSLRDFDRPLAPRGKRSAPIMGKALRARGPLPDLVMCSTAVRAKQTLKAAAAAADLDSEILFDERIYAASSAELMRLIRQLPDDRSVVLLVGHNPGFEETVTRLSGIETAMPTAALVCLDLAADRWTEVEDGAAQIRWNLTPRTLEQSK